MPRAKHLVNAGCSLPIENVNQVKRVPNEVYLQLSLLIDDELGCRVQDARALALVRVVQVELASRQVISGRSSVPVHLTEFEETVSDKTNLPSSWSWNHLNVTAVISQSACDLDVASRFHLAERVEQPLIPAFLECLHQYLLVGGSRVVIDVQRDAELRSHLSACAHGSSINGLGLVRTESGSAPYDEKTNNNKTGGVKLFGTWMTFLGELAQPRQSLGDGNVPGWLHPSALLSVLRGLGIQRRDQL